MSAFRPIDPNTQNFTNLSQTDAALKKIGSFTGPGAEISAYDPDTKRLFVVSGARKFRSWI